MGLPLIAGVAVAAAAATVVLRRMRDEAAERAALARRPTGEDGIIPGAHGFTLGRDRAPAVLLLHGMGDSPQAMRYLGDVLHGQGYSVHAPLLPGHGRTIRDFAGVTADAWIAAAREELRRLRRSHSWIAVVGLSMGGALAVRLAADPELAEGVQALVLLAPFLEPSPSLRRAHRFAPLWGAVTTYVISHDPRSIHDEIERERSLGYGIITPAALRALVETADAAARELPGVKAPTLVIQSRHDNRIPPEIAERAFARLGATEKQMVWRDVGGHIVTVDHGREDVFAAVVEWLNARRGQLRQGAAPAFA